MIVKDVLNKDIADKIGYGDPTPLTEITPVSKKVNDLSEEITKNAYTDIFEEKDDEPELER